MEKVYEQAGWTLLVWLFITLIKNVIYCIYLFVHKLKDKVLYGKGWGSPKYNEGRPRVFCFLYKYRQALCIEGPFLGLSLCKVIVRKTISSYNKELYFSAGESTVGFQMLNMELLDVNYFCFSLFSWTARSF